MKIAYQDLTVNFDEKRLQYLISAGKTTWQSKDSFSPYFTVKKEVEKGSGESLSSKENGIEYAFSSAGKVQHRIVKTEAATKIFPFRSALRPMYGSNTARDSSILNGFPFRTRM